jgi:hypothetical protein
VGRNTRLPYPDITKFLATHPSAKIVLVVDTHCLQETGAFVWAGAKDETLACTLWEVGNLHYD